MRIQVVKTVDKMPEGDYIGKIVYQSVSKDYKYLWLNIEVEGFSSQLNISIALSSNLLNDFALNFADTDGELDTEDFINERISFSLIDREINEHIYSKFSRLELISDSVEEENDFE